jgi:hypothetical protein
MTSGLPSLDHRPLRAPREDGGAFVAPPFDDVGDLLQGNLRQREVWDYDFQGRSLSDLAQESRRELVEEARRWTFQYREVDSGRLGPSTPIFLAGHQPELFHPGVWFKSFALGALAHRHEALAVNLLIDGDTVKTASLHVPGGSVTEPHVAAVPLDQAGPIVPYEERRIVDRQTFADFGRHAAGQIAPLVSDPLVCTYWPMAVRRMDETDNLGACLAQSRHQLEGRWGLTTLEIPQSRVCAMPSHGWFVAHLLAQLPGLWRIYNEVVGEYRRANRIRSEAHPVPNLAVDGDWLEAPFWIWTADDPQRRRLFARHGRNTVVLSDRQALEIDLPLSPDANAARAVERLAEISQKGVKIRPRALLTTLWARLALADVFIHGIGGAKYDQVTDALIWRFFRLKPPGFLVVSATLRLPIARKRTTRRQVRSIDRRLRELTFRPECHIKGVDRDRAACGETVAELIAAKTRWIRTPQTRENARTRYQEIRRINEALQPWVAPMRERLLKERQRAGRAMKAEAVLGSREYGFCLFPEKTLRDFLFSLLPKNG